MWLSTTSPTSWEPQKTEVHSFMFKVLCKHRQLIQLLSFCFDTVPAVIVEDPESMIELYRNGTTNISCSSTGIPVPTITWFKNNSELQFSNIIRLVETSQSNSTWGRRQSTVIFVSLQLTDTADYHCVANNSGAPGNTFVVQSDTSSIFVTRMYSHNIICS